MPHIELGTYVRTKLDEGSPSLLTSHFLSEVLPETPAFRRFKCPKFMKLMDGKESAFFAQNMRLSKKNNEHAAEDYQAVLDSFPLIDTALKKRCLLCYNDWTFEL